MRKISLGLLFLGAFLFLAAPAVFAAYAVKSATEVEYDRQTADSAFDAGAWHTSLEAANVGESPHDWGGFTSGLDPLGSNPNILQGFPGGLGSRAPRYSSPCPQFLDQNGPENPGGCNANNYSADFGMANIFGNGGASHTIVDDMLSKVMEGFGNADNHLFQQLEVMFMRDFIAAVDLQNAPALNQFPHRLSADLFSIFVDQTLDQDVAWGTGDTTSYLLSTNTVNRAGESMRSILHQRFQIGGSGPNGTITGYRTWAAWDPVLNTVALRNCAGSDGPCSIGLARTNGAAGTVNYGNNINGNNNAIDQWVGGFVKESDGEDGIVSSLDSWFMRENNFKECPTVFPGVVQAAQGPVDTSMLNNGTGGPCTYTYGVTSPLIHIAPEIDQHPAGYIAPQP
jgi:hypothetical protein